MSEDDEDRLCKFGTPLKPYEEDEIPSKKPIGVEDQVVRDVNGIRRFHGAFTGGFSAGFWNTVGSLEGWKPQTFKSSRQEKAEKRSQQAADFMDEEDMGEFGIAPQRVQTKSDFAHENTKGKRKFQKTPDGPIPGVPVLHSLLEPAKEKTVIRMMKKMGWKEGQGIGARMTRVEKKRAKERNKKELYIMKMYGCEMPGQSTQIATGMEEESDSGSDLSADYDITFAPDDFDPYVAVAKDNVFGLGYSGLERNPVLKQSQRFSLFAPLEIVDKNNKKLSISGQAFGVGALEDDDDDDIYAKDDMTRYDFSLDDKKSKKEPKAIKSAADSLCVEGFCAIKASNGKCTKKVFTVSLPDNFNPRNWALRKSRFAPMEEHRVKLIEERNKFRVKGLGRHDLTPETRGNILNETKKTSILDMINNRSSSFISKEIIDPSLVVVVEQHENVVEENEKVKKEAVKITKNLTSRNDGTFKPFLGYPDKQTRYEKFVDFKAIGEQSKDEYLLSIQPLSMSEWDREKEKKEFVQAQRLYRPLDGLMSDRFVSEASIVIEKPIEPGEKREIKMKRVKSMWKPHKDLCKRFNVAEPFVGNMVDEKVKKSTKFSVFDYLEAPLNTKSNFETPVIMPQSSIPKKQNEKQENLTSTSRLSAQEFFKKDDPIKIPDTINPSISKPPVLAPTIPKKVEEKKTDLEIKVAESVNKKPEEKKDLFKAIFCSSSEDENSENEEHEKSTPLSDADKLKMVENFVATKSASQFNILRNTSPPRGIFKSMFEAKSNDKLENSSIDDNEKEVISVDEDASSSSSEEEGFYGPKLPSSIPKSTTSATDNNLDSIILGKLKNLDSKGFVEKWVEKEHKSKSTSSRSASKKKKHHKEKHKKEKKHHKKGKKKHKHQDKD